MVVKRRTTGSDDELRTLGEIGAIAGRLEYLTRELVILLTDPQHPDVGVELTRELAYEPMLERARRLARLRLRDASVQLEVDAFAERAKSAMRARNDFLHARWDWHILEPPGSPASRYTHQRRTGEQLLTATTLSDLEAVADSLMDAHTSIIGLLYRVASTLDAVDGYSARVWPADGSK